MGYDGLGGRTKFIQPVSFPAACMAVVMLGGTSSVPPVSASLVAWGRASQTVAGTFRESPSCCSASDSEQALAQQRQQRHQRPELTKNINIYFVSEDLYDAITGKENSLL